MGLEQPVFYYDLGDPRCYLVAERIVSGLPVVAEWEPVNGRVLGAIDDELDRDAVEAAARAQQLQPVRWPPVWPLDSQPAMLAATYAKRIGRAVAFSLAAFRQAFAAGRDLGDLDTVLIAAAACEIHPSALVKGIWLGSVREALDAATERARTVGVERLPAIQVGSRVMEGADSVEEAAGALA